MESDDARRACLSGGGELGRLMRELDWASTPVGPIEGWPASLCSAIRVALAAKFGMYIAWGPEHIGFYNDMCRPILGSSKHPALGRPTRETFRESWHLMGPMFEQALGGEAVGADDWMLPLHRSGYLEECHFIVSFSPLHGNGDAIGGVLVTIAESTDRVLRERRARTFLDFSVQSAAPEAAVPDARRNVWQSLAAALAQNPWDLPFALFYELDALTDDARLVAATPGADAPELAPPHVHLNGAATAWPLSALLDGREAILVEQQQEQARALAWPAGSWAAPSERALVLPVTRPGRARPYGFLVAGISSGRALDEAYTGFLHALAAHAGAAVMQARAYEDEHRRAVALAEVDRAKTIFFSNVSHEVRTPLALSLGPAADLRAGVHGALNDQQTQQVGVIEKNALRLLKLVNNLLDFARIESGRVSASYEPVDLAQLTIEVASVFRSAIERAGLRFSVDCPPLREHYFVDREMWEKIVLNLLSNAFKFTFDGSIALRLREPEPGWADLIVEDTGVGIPEQERALIFKRFHRVSNVRGRHQEGSGIGLALVRELARLHGGDVEVRSVEGQGSAFRVRIRSGSAHRSGAVEHESAPLARAASTHAASAFVEEALRSLSNDPRQSLPPPAMVEPIDPVPAETAGARVLVVDDNADMRDYLRRLLATRFEVELASDGRSALELARQNPPELVITDVMMPNLDGFGLLRELREDARTQDVAVMMLSARAGEEARIEGLAKGANDYLTKPFGSRELIARANSQIALRRARHALEYNRAALYELFMQAPAPICVLRGQELVIEMANPSFARMIARRELLGKPLLEAVPELAARGLHAHMLEVLRTGASYAGRESLVQLGGDRAVEDSYFSFGFSPLRQPDGTTDRVMVFASEVTDQVRARTELEDARRRAEDASRAKDEFMAMLGHELRNPLAPITTALELMQQHGSDVFARERTIIGHQVQHLARLVDDLLDVSRITRGKIHLRTRAVELSEAVARAIEQASPLLEERRHRLRVEVPSRGLLVLGDELRLAQVVSNLLTNAAKYTEPGGDVSIRGERVDHSVVLRVRDSGMGIAPDLLPRVFDLFVQGARPQSGAGGLGLGLTLVRSLTELHGGKVAVHSEGLGHGSEFELRLPWLAAPPASEPAPEARDARGELPRRAARVSKRRVMIVDDNEDAAELLAEGLRRVGHEVRVAFEGPRGIDLARAFRPHVALLDLGLPVMDGYELARRLHELPEAAHTQLIAVTGYGQDKDRRRSAEAGFARHLVKPVDLATVDRNIRELVSDEPDSV